MKLLILFFLIVLSFFVFSYIRNSSEVLEARPAMNVLDTIGGLFPKSKQEIDDLVTKTEKDSRARLEKICGYHPKQRTFSNTMRALDLAEERFSIVQASLSVLSMASPDKEVRDASQQALMRLGSFAVDSFISNPLLYNACVEYESLLKSPQSKEKLTKEERYFVDQRISDLSEQGFDKPQEIQEEIKKLQKEINDLSLAFQMNIAKDKRHIEVSREGLVGLDDEFIDSLQKTESGHYRIGVDEPTYNRISDECSVEETRKKLYKQFAQRGYPANEEVLASLICLRDRLAHLLGYSSYADYDISDQMAKTPDAVEAFLADMSKRTQIKASKEIEALKKELPVGVTLAPHGLLYPWDIRYLQHNYKKNHLEYDEQVVAEYFPFEHTFKSLLGVYEKFFGLNFKKIEAPKVWHKDVECLAVYKKGSYLGTVFLDLFPRENKFTHAAQLTIVPSVKTVQGKLSPSVLFVVANFPPARGDKPSLLTRKDVATFFHEFGHAIHALVGSTELASFAGTNVKGDFLEMPSQMLEEWMWEPAILKLISKHYKTGQPLPDDLIEKIRLSKNLFSGTFVLNMLFGSYISLAYFLPPAKKDVNALWKSTYMRLYPYMYYDSDNRGYCAFLHLPPYGAKYYGYLWSRVYAADLFYAIKAQDGLLNNVVGERYINQVIGKGGSEDPAVLLKSFLGRDPQSDAFFKDIGVEKGSAEELSKA
ncbi:Zn-dependent oligopeptidase [Candidatus Dependentiae bacterium]|nr:Zn-dependent oligopeptidase [Candidatus Dependentiae bacterium]